MCLVCFYVFLCIFVSCTSLKELHTAGLYDVICSLDCCSEKLMEAQDPLVLAYGLQTIVKLKQMLLGSFPPKTKNNSHKDNSLGSAVLWHFKAFFFHMKHY